MLYKSLEYDIKHAGVENTKHYWHITNREVVYQDLGYNNMPPILIDENSKIVTRDEEQSAYSFFDYYDAHIAHFLENSKIPKLVIETEGSFTNLDKIRYKRGLLKYLNKKGLHIYFRELPYVKIQKGIKWVGGEIQVPTPKEEKWNEYKKTVFGFDHSKYMRCYEFDVIEKWAKINGLTNVHVYTGWYNSKEYLQKYYKINIHTHDLILPAMARKDNIPDTPTTFNPTTPLPNIDRIKYKFLSTNRRYDAIREIVVNYLYDKNSLLSYYNKHVDFMVGVGKDKIDGQKWDWLWEDIDRRLWQPYSQMPRQPKLRNFDYLKIDKDPNDDWLDLNDLKGKDDTLPLGQYTQCFLYVICESLYAFPFGHFSEKTLGAFKAYRPFVLFSSPYTLEYMQKIGFKTFNSFWDESYDKETNHTKRMDKVFNIIDEIDKLSINDCKELYLQMKPILLHNHNHLNVFSTKQFKSIP